MTAGVLECKCQVNLLEGSELALHFMKAEHAGAPRVNELPS